MADLMLDAEPRTAMGKKNRALRAAGLIPIHVYGLKDAPASLQAEEKHLVNVLKAAGRTSPITVKTADTDPDITLVRDIATHPVSGQLLHVDFMRVDITQTVQAPVPVMLINQDIAPGIRGGNGFVTQGVYEVLLEARPGNIPPQVEADCEVLEGFDDAVLARDMTLPSDATLISDPAERIAWIQPPRVAEEDADEEEIEGVEAAESEASTTADEDG